MRPLLGRAPAWLALPAAVAVVFLVVPLLALLLQTPWRDLLDLVGTAEVRDALRLTALTSACTVVLCLLFGTPLAWVLARARFRGLAALRALIVVPLVLPPVVAGVALLAALGRRGLVGEPLAEAFGVRIPYTTAAVVIAHTFVALPFFVLAVEGAFRTAGAEFDTVAATLGADRWTTFRRVTLPLALPGLAAGCALAWARSLGEFGATITFAGNYPGATRTMPSLIYTELQGDPEVARTLSLILLLVSILVLGALRDRWLRPGVGG
ncbi:ABC transporter permease [Nocardioides sp.]|uniref:ABC transporter permease n=1 Tax=Nocardioides sp. TaxID=35761 RepID=UPI0035197849